MATSATEHDGKALKKEGAKWIERIKAAWSREDSWAKDAEAAVKAYTNEAAGSGTLYDYNILHANTETIVPAIINTPPIPDVRRRFGDDDPVAKQVADIIERAISVQVDDSRLEAELEGQAQDGFLAGRGVIRLRFHADTEATETSALEAAEDEAEADDQPEEVAGETGEGERYESAPETVSGERITFEAVSWRDYQHGPAKRWEDRPWESFRHVMQCDDVKGFADETLVRAQTDPKDKLFGDDSDHAIYEVWDKRKMQVLFVHDDGRILKRITDPLGLTGFFPTSRPVQPIELVGRLMPVTPFSIYKRLADELDVVTKRIRVLTAAMKIKGGVLGGIATDLKALAEADDNELVTLSELEALAQTAGLDKGIVWWPVDKFYPVLAELFKNRDLTKQAIYEITGISDIVRGASKASETLGAQQIKSQWGALRIQKMQRMMERSARDLFVMMSEIISGKFSLMTLEKVTGIPILPAATDTPEQVQRKQAVIALLKQPITTYYRVDVESQSTVRADLTMKKQEMSEFLAGSAAFFQGMAPVVESGGPEALEGTLEVYAAATRNFDLGKSAEDAIERMVTSARTRAQQARDNPQPPQPSPEEIKAQAETRKAELAAQQAQAKAQSDQASAQVQIETVQAKAQADIAKVNAGVEAQRIDTSLRVAETNAAMERERQAHALEMQKGALELTKITAEIEKIRAGTAATIQGAQAKADAAKTQEKSA